MGLAAKNRLFRRDCVVCPPTTPSCPNCEDNEVCSLQPQSCNTCAEMTCVVGPGGGGSATGPDSAATSPAPAQDSNPGDDGGSNQTAGIAGGVVGAFAALAIGAFLYWYFVIRTKKRRAILEETRRSYYSSTRQSAMTQPTMTQPRMAQYAPSSRPMTRVTSPVDYRMSTASGMSSTSNAIQIAYVPFVEGQPNHQSSQDIFFSADDLGRRNTTYSQWSAGRQSITPSLDRGSVMSGVFQEDGIENPMPAISVAIQRPQVVSVRNGSKPSSPTEMGTATHVVLPGAASGSPGAASGDSSAASANTFTFVKPTLTTVKRNPSNSKGRFPVRSESVNSKSNSSSSTASSPGLVSSPPNLDASPVTMSATATTPWGTDLSREIESTSRSLASPRHPRDPFSDDHVADHS